MLDWSNLSWIQSLRQTSPDMQELSVYDIHNPTWKKKTKNYSIVKFSQDNANGENMIKRINVKFNYKQ